MLCVKRKKTESLLIGNEIKVVVNQVVGGRVSLGIEAPEELKIDWLDTESKDRPTPVGDRIAEVAERLQNRFLDNDVLHNDAIKVVQQLAVTREHGEKGEIFSAAMSFVNAVEFLLIADERATNAAKHQTEDAGNSSGPSAAGNL